MTARVCGVSAPEERAPEGAPPRHLLGQVLTVQCGRLGGVLLVAELERPVVLVDAAHLV